MTERLHWGGVVIDSAEPQRLSRFWAAVLGYEIVEDEPGWVEMRSPTGARPHLTCQGINQHVQHGASTSQGNRFHLDVGGAPGIAMSRAEIEATTAWLEELGARPVERIGPPGQVGHWVWADPEGNVFCAPGL